MNSSGLDSNTLNLQRSEDLIWPSRQTDQPLALRRSQFEALKRSIDRCKTPINWLGNAAWFFIALGATSGLSLIPFIFAQSLPTWVIPLYIVVTIASLILGVVLLVLEQREIHHSHQDIMVVKEEIAYIEAQYLYIDSPKAVS